MTVSFKSNKGKEPATTLRKEQKMDTIALIVGGLLFIIGILGVMVGFFPPNDGALAIAGAVVFGAGMVSKALTTRSVE